ncbi:unnamed protein product, partial [Didymodactylos carnosus]
NKHRNFKNLTKTCSKRHQVWQCCVDYNADGRLSRSVLKNDTHLHCVSPLSDELLKDLQGKDHQESIRCPDADACVRFVQDNGKVEQICLRGHLEHKHILGELNRCSITGSQWSITANALKLLLVDNKTSLILSSFTTTNGGSTPFFDEHTNSLNSRSKV